MEALPLGHLFTFMHFVSVVLPIKGPTRLMITEEDFVWSCLIKHVNPAFHVRMTANREDKDLASIRIRDCLMFQAHVKVP
jgi:hypothetical protein